MAGVNHWNSNDGVAPIKWIEISPGCWFEQDIDPDEEPTGHRLLSREDDRQRDEVWRNHPRFWEPPCLRPNGAAADGTGVLGHRADLPDYRLWGITEGESRV